MSLHLIHDQIEVLQLQGYFCSQRVHSAKSAVDGTPSQRWHISHPFQKTDFLSLSQQRQSLAKRNNTAQLLGSNSSHWLIKHQTVSFISSVEMKTGIADVNRAQHH